MNDAGVKDRIERALGMNITALRAAGGGDAARSVVLETGSGERLFAKTVSTGAPFPMEALGLERLREAGGVRVPEVRYVEERLLVLECVEFGRPAPDFQERLGRGLAVTHRAGHTAYGFEADHYIGVTPQKNQPWVPDAPGAWAEFWWIHRLEPMLRRLHDDRLRRRVAALEPRVAEIIGGSAETPRLLHGDLWSGNVAADASGSPVIYDPAPYYGHREADLAMTRMFGGFTADFYHAYHETSPLPEGWRDRLDFYMLYHVLNHQVIFGSGYAGQAERILDACLQRNE